ncbi:MAG: hypothetical protein WCZ01_05930 [Candidatus Neomarinimicrobiota bacterium]
MDNYESAITALKIPFIPLGLRFPAGDVLNAVSKLNGQILGASFYSPSLLMPNDQ